MKIYGIQFLRALAAALVLAMHATQAIADHMLGLGKDTYWHAGGVGVHIFFVISGFIIFVSAPEHSGPEAARLFLLKRLIRVVPAYWLYTMLKILALLAAGTAVFTASGGWQHVVASFAFVPAFSPNGELFPVLQVGWTLNYEMVFYLAFGLVIALAQPRVLGAGVLIGIVYLLGCSAPPDSAMAFYGRGIVFDFCLGMGVAWIHRHRAPLQKRYAWLCVITSVGAFSVLQSAPIDSFISVGMPSAALVYGVLCLEPSIRESRFAGLMVVLGDASYALYLSHPFVVAAVVRLLGKVAWVSPALAFVLLMTSCLAASVLAYRFLEKPMLTRLNAYLLPRRAERQPGNAA